MNATTADFECDIAYGEKSREFLGQSVGFENELISQTNFPPPRTPTRTWLFFLLDRFLGEGLENRPETAASAPEYAVKGLPYARRKADAGCGLRRENLALSRTTERPALFPHPRRH
jgi:hypothetical protein